MTRNRKIWRVFVIGLLLALELSCASVMSIDNPVTAEGCAGVSSAVFATKEEVVEKTIPGQHGDWKIKITKRKGGEYDLQKDRIDVWFTPKENSKGCKNICTAQTVKTVAYDADGNKLTSHTDEFYTFANDNPFRHTIDDQISDGQDYVVIDHTECEGDPFDNGSDKLHDIGSSGNAASSPVKPAHFYDEPGLPIGTRDKKKEIRKIVMTFEACAICADTGEILGSISWQCISTPGDRGDITLISTKEDRPSEIFEKAFRKFVKNHSREKVDKGVKTLRWYCPEICSWLAGPRGIFGDPWGDPIPEEFIKTWLKGDGKKDPSGCDSIILRGPGDAWEWDALGYEAPGMKETGDNGKLLELDESMVGDGKYCETPEEACEKGMNSVERSAIKFTWSGDQRRIVKGIILTSYRDISSEDVNPFVEPTARFSNDFEILTAYFLPTKLMHHLLDLVTAHAEELAGSQGCVTVSILVNVGTEDAAAFTGALKPEHVASIIAEAASHETVTLEILELFNFIGLNYGKITLSQYVPPVEFFVDQIGNPGVVIVVGSGAAEMDADSAAVLAAKVGKMASRDAEPVLIMTDTDFDFAGWKSGCDYNLILIGGPVVNSVVDFLVHEGISMVAWKTSRGEGEYLVNPYGTGCHILIVAGADRDGTWLAARSLIQWV